MPKPFREDLIVMVSASLAWAIFIFGKVVFWVFWLVVPSILFGGISTLAVCSLLRAKPISRPFLALIPVGLTALPALWHEAHLTDSDGMGRLAINMALLPALLAAAGYFVYLLIRRHEA